MRYFPHSEADVRQMLEKIGARDVDELFEQIPKDLRLARGLSLEEPLSEPELMEHLASLAARNPADSKPSFMGAGAYRHHVSPVVDQLLMRSELYTAYTPYQPEVSQGTLQVIFEFQTMICRLFEMGYANASMYDGASAAAEAVLMARRVATGRDRVLVSQGVHPEYLDTIRTYLAGVDRGSPKVDVVPLDPRTGATNISALKERLDDSTAAVVIGYPNFFGVVDDLDVAASLAREAGALTVSVTSEPVSLGVIAPPGSLGADIAVGEGQPLGIPLSFGGPGLGLFACRDDKKLLRQMPGRLVGQTADVNGNKGFVLTLATREQHIRREKATSNICTNHGLMALAATVHLSLLGKTGFESLSRSCLSKAEYLKKGIASLSGFSIRFSGPTFNEVAVRAEGKRARDVLEKLDFQGGVDLGRFHPDMDDTFLVAVTELHTKRDLDAYLDNLKSM